MDKTVKIFDKITRFTHGFILNRYNPLLLFNIKSDFDYKSDREIILQIGFLRIKYIFSITFTKVK